MSTTKDNWTIRELIEVGSTIRSFDFCYRALKKNPAVYVGKRERCEKSGSLNRVEFAYQSKLYVITPHSMVGTTCKRRIS
ncbi:hypothetical protein JCM19235_1929 [Vibrio maritimus]|uniref:Uncharacterized protein n=1 Tax=Vibrio maritimus TaxID=990268 RepID=A0A090RTD0_9VIBR|nr:hypothetical protein JCM19235_1929 [Vibrio maritimus]